MSFVNLTTGMESCGKESVHDFDWALPKCVENGAMAKLVSIQAHESDDEGFTVKHLLNSVLVRNDCDLDVKYLV